MHQVSQIRFPEGCSTLPLLTMNRVHRDPFKELEALSFSEGNGVPHTVANIIRNLHRKFRAVTLVTGAYDPPTPKKIFRHSAMARRMGSSAFFVMDEDGGNLAIADPDKETVKLMFNFGADQEMHSDQLERMYGVLAVQERRILPELLQCEQGSLVLATGAGIGPENATLAQHARERKGVLVCHDLLPSIVRSARQRLGLKDLPYAILPPRPEFLVPLLRSHPGPRHIVGTNLLSVCTHVDIDNLLATAEQGDANRVLLYQRNGMPDTHSMIPGDWWLGKPAFMRSLNTFFDDEIRAGRLDEEETSGQNNSLICAQALRTFHAIVWEALRMYLVRSARACGWNPYILRLQQETILEGPDAQRTVRTTLPDALNGKESFERSCFNELHAGILRERYGVDPTLPPGSLRQTLSAFAVVLTRNGSTWKAPSELSFGTITELSEIDPLLPPEPWSTLDDRHRWMNEENDPEHRIRRATMRVVHRIIFEKIWKQQGCNLFAVLVPAERERLSVWCREQFCPDKRHLVV